MHIMQRFTKTTISIVGIAILLLSVCCDEQINLSSIASEDKQNKYCQQYKQPFSYSVCQVKQSTLLEQKDKLKFKLYWRNHDDNTNKSAKPIYTFDNLLNNNLASNEKLIFAMNAGMYNQKYAPIGYTVMDTKQILSLNLNEGVGNFHLMPNGVFWWDDAGFYITESDVMGDMLKSGTKARYATQSGPMLVINGKIHPQFSQKSTSKKIRNGVGLCEGGMIKLVISDMPVTFYKFAKLFQETLKCDNALFLDGGVASAMYAPEINRNSPKDMGVILALIEKQ